MSLQIRKSFGVGCLHPTRWSYGLALLLILAFSSPASAQTTTGVCDRTAQVRDALVRATGSRDCNEVTDARLAALAHLVLSGHGITTLQAGDFADLSALTLLLLNNNALTELPAGLFEGVSKLTVLQLQDNPGAPFELVVGLTRTDAAVWAPGPATVVATAPLGAPFPLTANLAAVNGSLSSRSLTLAAGRVIGRNPIMVTALSNGTTRLTFEAPRLPTSLCSFFGGGVEPCFNGLVTVVRPLTLFFIEPPTVLPIPDTRLPPGDSVRLVLADYFSSPAGKSLRYTAIASDPSLATVRITGGVLLIIANDNGEEGTLTVTIAATDSDGATATATITVVIDAVTVLPIPDTRLPAGDSARLALADYFSSPAGKSLRYTAIASDPSLATVRITGGVLLIIANDNRVDGTLRVTVTATDSDGGADSATITVVIEAATGDSLLRGWRLPWLMGDLRAR